MSRRRRLRRVLGCAAAALLVWACAEPEPEAGEDVVARVAGDEIRAAELDASLTLALHDLERARYDLRRGALRGLAAHRLSGDPAEVARAERSGELQLLLEPPEPPRLVLEVEGLPIRGAEDASVVVTIFCDFDARACARIQPALRVLEAEFAGRVRIEHRDFPAAGREPGLAAEALGCAGEQGAATAFHEALYARADRRDRNGLARVADGAGLDPERFRACLEEGEQAARIAEGVVMARHLGVRSVPSGFVNGLYVTGAEPEELRRLVARELRRAGLDDAPQRLAASTLGLTLVGMVHHRRADASLATIRIGTRGRSQSFRPGETVVGDVVLEEVRRDGVVLRDGEKTEFLAIRRVAQARRSPAPAPAPEAPPAPLAAEPDQGGIRVVYLRRDEVDGALADWESLDDALLPGAVDPDGRVLLELDDTRPGDLYDRLGLEPGDVLLQVEGELIDERENPLWDVLQASSRIELVVARDGEPRIFEIEIE